MSALHPTIEQLQACAAGMLEREELEQLGRHLNQCDTCLDLLETLPEDRLLTLVRASLAIESSLLGETIDAPVFPGSDRYELLELLDSGGMGQVYQGHDHKLDRGVALKVIRPERAGDEQIIHRFRREIQAVARLAHPNIVSVFDAEMHGDALFIVMELVSGRRLDRIVQSDGPLPIPDACRYCIDAAHGLQHAFERGIVHRDVKPQNLMRAKDGNVKVVDFGLARLFLDHPAQPMTREAAYLGTPAYTAPEQIRDARQADVRSDVYSLGCTLYFLLTGQPPYPGASELEITAAHLRDEPPDARSLRPEVPPELASLIARMLAKDPAARPQTHRELADALAPFATAPAQSQRAVPFQPKKRCTAWLLAGAALVLFGLIVCLRVKVDRQGASVKVSVAWDGEPAANSAALSVVVPAGAVELVGHSDLVRSLCFSPDGRTILSASHDRTARLWEAATGRLIHVQSLPWPAHVGVFAPDGARMLVAAKEHGIGVWDVAAIPPEPLAVFAAAGVAAAAFAKDGGEVIAARWDGVLTHWDVATQQVLRTHDIGQNLVYADVRPALNFMLFGSGGLRVHVWTLEPPAAEWSLSAHTDRVRAVAGSAQFERALTGGDDKAVRLWDLEKRKLMDTFTADAPIRSLAFSPDQSHAAAGTDAGSVCVWDLGTRTALAVPKTHTAAVWSIAFSPDGQHLVTGDATGKIILRRTIDANGTKGTDAARVAPEG